jgi:hypothetical protein
MPGPKSANSRRLSLRHDLSPRNANHPGNFSGYLEGGFVLFAFGAGRLV